MADEMPEPRLRVVLWYRDGKQLQVPPSAEMFSPAQLIDDQFLRLADARSYVVVPLCLGVKTLGVGIYEAGSPDGAVYEALSAEFSAALEAVIEREEGAERQAQQERLIDQVVSAWRDLDRTHLGKQGEALEEYIGKLIQTRQQLDTLRVREDGPQSEASPETLRDAGKSDTPRQPSQGRQDPKG
jgi:hypothetical protein